MFERPVSDGNRVALVCVAPERNKLDDGEFRSLALSAGADIVCEFEVIRDRPAPKYYVGLGKAEEVARVVEHAEVDVVLFDQPLTPAQERNLEKLMKCRVLDRAGLILDIFAQRARSFEGKLQVELAQLQHIVTRLVRGWTHLERQKGGIGLRGPGETQLETDRRLIRQRIDHIKKRLQKVRKQRAQGRRSRQRAAIPTVSLVGYTNAGKSTLFNAMTQAEVYVADQLFATLDTTLRQLTIQQFGQVVLTDTVGFVRDLPHELVAAFRATLEETRDASLLLHVIDASDAHRHERICQVSAVLDEIGASDVPCLQVFNKVDCLSEVKPRIDRDEEGVPQRVWVSAQYAQGFDLLSEAIAERLCCEFIHCCLILSTKQGRFRAKLYDHQAVISESATPRGDTCLEIRLPRDRFDQLSASQ
ncbi:MAG: GTPase HflX [Legionellaceae bacterium]|nr:GTPase HflX [Legionellaceae bacterium]